ncbi:hypothetical protein [Novosphingobium naphthalenivorans]|uniref:hypothetical protein n=1 Tax=Novosphingobium naphthalenivorans TaxID=273168 RepID=UPI000AA23D91|nr:hypothetical protein [Novosphingobium naphthalenivorans]
MKKVPFSTTVAFDSLPTLSADHRAERARAWRRIAIALAGFWIVAAFAIAALV